MGEKEREEEGEGGRSQLERHGRGNRAMTTVHKDTLCLDHKDTRLRGWTTRTLDYGVGHSPYIQPPVLVLEKPGDENTSRIDDGPRHEHGDSVQRKGVQR